MTNGYDCSCSPPLTYIPWQMRYIVHLLHIYNGKWADQKKKKQRQMGYDYFFSLFFWHTMTILVRLFFYTINVKSSHTIVLLYCEKLIITKVKRSYFPHRDFNHCNIYCIRTRGREYIVLILICQY